MTDERTTTLPGGVEMPAVGLGTWELTGEAGRAAMTHALRAGYRHLDTATGYGNETEVGQALRSSGVPREEVFLTTKLPPGAAGRERATIEESLRSLRVDHVDLWLVHWPPDGTSRPQTWEQMLSARDDGLARAVGVSNYSTAEIDELVAATGEGPAVNQVPWGPSRYDARLLQEHRDRGVVVEGYSPLKNSRPGDPAIADVAEAHGVTPEQVVLRWHIQHGVVVIPKSATPERIERNLDLFGFALDDDEMSRVDGLGGRR
jgi:diketogulonate reductase-like aldo/keto reductase